MVFGKLQKTVGDALELPSDVIGDGTKITITGRREVIIENYLEITTFSGEEISLATREGELYLTGKGLTFKTVLPTELHIEGEFISLGYKPGKGGK